MLFAATIRAENHSLDVLATQRAERARAHYGRDHEIALIADTSPIAVVVVVVAVVVQVGEQMAVVAAVVAAHLDEQRQDGWRSIGCRLWHMACLSSSRSNSSSNARAHLLEWRQESDGAVRASRNQGRRVSCGGGCVGGVCGCWWSGRGGRLGLESHRRAHVGEHAVDGEPAGVASTLVDTSSSSSSSSSSSRRRQWLVFVVLVVRMKDETQIEHVNDQVEDGLVHWRYVIVLQIYLCAYMTERQDDANYQEKCVCCECRIVEPGRGWRAGWREVADC